MRRRRSGGVFAQRLGWEEGTDKGSPGNVIGSYQGMYRYMTGGEGK